MKQLFIVMKETYLRHVKSWSFVFMVLSPFLFIGISVGSGYLAAMAQGDSDPVALVASKELTADFAEDSAYSLAYDTEEKAQAALEDEDISGYIRLNVKNNQLQATYRGKDAMDFQTKAALTEKLDQIQSQLNQEVAGLSSQQEEILAQKPLYEEVIAEDSELARTIQSGVISGMAVFLYMLLIVYSSTTAQEIAGEKGTKIMEVIFSSIQAPNYFYGRVLAIMGVVLTHISIYVLGFFISYALASQSPQLAPFLSDHQDVLAIFFKAFSPNTICFMLFALIFYIVLSAACGALVIRVEDVNKAVQPVILLVVVALMLSVTLGFQEGNIVLRLGSYIPFFAPFFMPIRVIHGDASQLEAWLSLLILVATTGASVWFIGKIYGGLILQTDDLGLWKSFQKALKHR